MTAFAQAPFGVSAKSHARLEIQKSPTNPDLSGRDITTYEYDLQGSLLKEESADICRQYLYNDFHQCIQTDVIRGREESAERLVQENLYDGEGLRFAIIENGKRTGFITDGWNNVAEIDENGRVTKRIIRGMGIVVSEDTEQKEDNIFTTSYHYYHGNERMDVEYITDEAGNAVNSYTYDAFGSIISSNETIQNRYTYNGEAYDKTTEQYYLRKRYYNPKLCRFTQEDEYRGDGLNLYAFCANNPVMYVDPSGYKCETGNEADRDADESATGGNRQTSQNDVDEVIENRTDTNNILLNTELAQVEAQKVVNVGNAIKAFDTPSKDRFKNPVTSVIVHEDGTVSVGISGAANGNNTSIIYAQKLQAALNESAGYEKYKVSAITDGDLLDQIVQVDSGNIPGVCAEPKAATAAHENNSLIVGMDTRYYTTENVPHSYNGTNQMKPCDTCEKNMEVYIKYAKNE